jgi:20S proteasome alpha/beta subunit
MQPGHIGLAVPKAVAMMPLGIWPRHRDRQGPLEQIGRPRVTIGIAAECQHDGKHAVVMCCDWQGTMEDFVKSDDVYKFRFEANSTMLIAGEPSAADEIVALLTPVLRKFDALDKVAGDFDLRLNAFLADLRGVAQKRKDAMVDHYLSMRYNLPFEKFYKEAGKFLPSTDFTHILEEIKYVELGASVLICYPNDEESLIARINGNGHVGWVDNYACIGTGATIALSVLCQHDWDNEMPLMDCLARVYAAKLAAQKDPNVGIATAFEIRVRGAPKALDLSDAGFKYLKRRVPQFRLPKNLRFDPAFFETIND